MRPITPWISESEAQSIYSSRYWNNVEEEKKKAWWIADGNHQQCIDYLEQSGLLQEFHSVEKTIDGFSGNSIKIADLAAGIGWTSALLSRLPNVAEVHAVEVSQHRLSDLFEISFRMMEGDEQKLHRYLGSFYDLKFEDKSIDIILLAQAFHHANRPLHLLVECDRVLKDGGLIILIGEHHISFKLIIRGFLSKLIKKREIVTAFHDLFPPDHNLGDHYYRISDYEFMFRALGYRLELHDPQNGNMMFVAEKPVSNLHSQSS